MCNMVAMVRMWYPSLKIMVNSTEFSSCKYGKNCKQMAKDIHACVHRPTVVPMEYQDALYVHLMHVIMSLVYFRSVLFLRLERSESRNP